MVGLWLNIPRLEANKKLVHMEATLFSDMEQIVPREWIELTSITEDEVRKKLADVNTARHSYRARLKSRS